jgi:hypothetical protein
MAYLCRAGNLFPDQAVKLPNRCHVCSHWHGVVSSQCSSGNMFCWLAVAAWQWQAGCSRRKCFAGWNVCDLAKHACRLLGCCCCCIVYVSDGDASQFSDVSDGREGARLAGSCARPSVLVPSMPQGDAWAVAACSRQINASTASLCKHGNAVYVMQV